MNNLKILKFDPFKLAETERMEKLFFQRTTFVIGKKIENAKPGEREYLKTLMALHVTTNTNLYFWVKEPYYKYLNHTLILNHYDESIVIKQVEDILSRCNNAGDGRGWTKMHYYLEGFEITDGITTASLDIPISQDGDSQPHEECGQDTCEISLKSIDFPRTSCWTEEQFERFNFNLNIVICDKETGTEHNFSTKIISTRWLMNRSSIHLYLQNAIVLSRYSELAVENAISTLIIRANINEHMDPLKFITHLLQYENGEIYGAFKSTNNATETCILEKTDHRTQNNLPNSTI